MEQLNNSTAQQLNNSTTPFIKLNRCTLLLLLLFLTQTIVQAQQQQWQFVNQFGSPWMDSQNPNDEEIYDIVVDDSGNIYISGITYGEMRIDTFSFWSSPGDITGFVAKFNCNSQLEWYQNIDIPGRIRKSKTTDDLFLYTITDLIRLKPNGDTSLIFRAQNSSIRNINIDPLDRIYVIVHGQNEYASGYSLIPNTSFIAVHDTTGVIHHFKSILRVDGSLGMPTGDFHFHVDNNNDLYIGGTSRSTHDTIYIEGGDTILLNKGGGNTQAFLIKLDSLGNLIWSKQSEGGGD